MTTNSTKQSGTKTSTKGTGSLAKVQAKAAKRTTKIAAKHQAIREAGKPKAEAAKPELMMSVEQMIANAAGEALAQTPAPGKKGKRVPWRERAAVINAENNEKFAAQAGGPTSPLAHDNMLLRVEPGQFADALNKATVEQLEDALKLECWSPKQRGRIGAALKTRTKPVPAADIAKTVAAVQAGDLTKGIEVPTARKKKPTTKPAKDDGKMSGLDAAAKVLAESPTPLNARQIVQQAAAKGYWTSPRGKTPHATIYAAMTVEIAKKGDQARFKKTDRGLFTVTDAGKQAK
jgi:hypothetical protein